MQTRANLTTFISILRESLPFLRERYQVDSLGVFGSFVRDDQRADLVMKDTLKRGIGKRILREVMPL